MEKKYKVISIDKHCRAATYRFYLIVDRLISDDDIEYLVEDVCAKDVSGSIYGYTCKWYVEHETEVIKEAVTDRQHEISRKIKVLSEEWDNLKKYRLSLDEPYIK